MHKTTVVLEQSTNTHAMTGEVLRTAKAFKDGSMIVEGRGVVGHGEHGPIGTEEPMCHKFNQQELNPVTQALQNAFD